MHGMNKRKGKRILRKRNPRSNEADKDCKRERKKNKCTPAN
jgi:hypothetical protein